MKSYIKIMERLRSALFERGIEFDAAGYGRFPAESIVRSFPGDIVPYYDRRRSSASPEETAICFFSDDDKLRRRIEKLDDDIDEYKRFYCVCGFDLSPIFRRNVAEQEFFIQLSQLATLYLAINGVKILPNFRIGDLTTLRALDAYPRDSPFAVGTLGCARNDNLFNEWSLRHKILKTWPSWLAIYGTLAPRYKKILDDYGFNYRVYEDFQKRSRAAKNEKGGL